jgi:hypothetical protein
VDSTVAPAPVIAACAVASSALFIDTKYRAILYTPLELFVSDITIYLNGQLF